jgi:hypothetical protein
VRDRNRFAVNRMAMKATRPIRTAIKKTPKEMANW